MIKVRLVALLAAVVGTICCAESAGAHPNSTMVNLQTQKFTRQGTDEFLLDARYRLNGLKQSASGGVDLEGYSIEIEVAGEELDGRDVQVFIKGPAWMSLYGAVQRTTGKRMVVRFDPRVDARAVSEFSDLTQIWGIGLKVFGGTRRISIVSARLVKQLSS